MRNLAKTFLKNLPDSGRIGVLGIGSDQRGDDAAGLIAAREIRRRCGKSRRVRVFLGETAPENLTSDIRRFNPRHLVAIDASASGARPGTVRIAQPEELDGPGLTHRLPLRILLDYLRAETGCGVTVVLIEAGSVAFGSPPSAGVVRASRFVAQSLCAALLAREP